MHNAVLFGQGPDLTKVAAYMIIHLEPRTLYAKSNNVMC